MRTGINCSPYSQHKRSRKGLHFQFSVRENCMRVWQYVTKGGHNIFHNKTKKKPSAQPWISIANIKVLNNLRSEEAIQ